MALVNQHTTFIFDLVNVWRTNSPAHQDYASSTAQTVVHSALKTGALLLAHLEIGDDRAR